METQQPKPIPSNDIHLFMEYEIRSSRWAKLISWDWLQELSAHYFAKKTLRKFNRYKKSLIDQQTLF